jgi:hypothetical protein
LVLWGGVEERELLRLQTSEIEVQGVQLELSPTHTHTKVNGVDNKPVDTVFELLITHTQVTKLGRY